MILRHLKYHISDSQSQFTEKDYTHFKRAQYLEARQGYTWVLRSSSGHGLALLRKVSTILGNITFVGGA